MANADTSAAARMVHGVYLETGDEHWQLALAAQRDLSRMSRHRAVGMADLLIASVGTHFQVVYQESCIFDCGMFSA
ncbi:hypothetical protein [Gordonia rhizosphera]|uniref:hypothetical protein n=1 Tax=Gordonia rhizosphera TaxID=83341 RepID=UPI000590C0E2|nr:hypothetical protein [Gordonia rhizosphera]